MGPIEGRPGLSSIMTADIPAGLALVSEAGWNQTAADWRFMLAAGRGRGLRDDSGRLIASSIVLPYRPGVGWVGMVLVGAAYRKRGHATRLIEDAVAYCRTAGLVPMLDATPPGREVYRRLGFADGETIERWRGQGGGGTVAAGVTDVERAIELDRAAFGADRSALIVDLAQRAGAPFLSFAGGTLLGRRGRTAAHLGALLASERATALTLCGLNDAAPRTSAARLRPARRPCAAPQARLCAGGLFTRYLAHLSPWARRCEYRQRS